MCLYLVKILIDLSQGRLDFSSSDKRLRIPSLCKLHLADTFGNGKIKASAEDPTHCFVCSSKKLACDDFCELPSVLQVKAVPLLKVAVGPPNQYLMMDACQHNSLIFNDDDDLPPLIFMKSISLRKLPMHRDVCKALREFVKCF